MLESFLPNEVKEKTGTNDIRLKSDSPTIETVKFI